MRWGCVYGLLPFDQYLQIHPSLLSVLEYPVSRPVMMMFTVKGILFYMSNIPIMLLNNDVYLWPHWSWWLVFPFWSSFTLRHTHSRTTVRHVLNTVLLAHWMYKCKIHLCTHVHGKHGVHILTRLRINCLFLYLEAWCSSVSTDSMRSRYPLEHYPFKICWDSTKLCLGITRSDIQE